MSDFDVAIGALIWHELNIKLTAEGKKQLQDAQRVLEAAAKVDKDEAYDWIDREYRHFTPDNQNDYHALMQLRALLFALPDNTDEKKKVQPE